MDEPLKVQRHDGVTTITMDDGKANVMSVRMLQSLHRALQQAQQDDSTVVLTGRAGMFSGGFDLAVFKRDPTETLLMLTEGARLTERLLSFPRPVLAVCTGHAIAMGAFILLCADVRIGVDHGPRLQANEVQIGMTLPRFAIEVMRQRLSPAQLQLAAVTALPYSPLQAVAAGFLDELTPVSGLAESARIQLERLGKLDPKAFAATKQRLREATLTALHHAIHADIADWTARFQ
jgi:enoyl-CoA hydratase